MSVQVLLMVAIRAVIVYAFLFGVVRLLGKRKLGVHSGFDLMITILLANLAGEAIFGTVALWHALLAVAAVAASHYAGYYLAYRNPRVKRWVAVKPTVVIRDGEFVPRGLVSEQLSEENVWVMLRQYGIEDLSVVKLGMIESSGRLSVIRQEWAREAQKRDLDVVPERG